MIEFSVRCPDEGARARAYARWGAVAKPLHSLGALEDLVAQLAAVQGTEEVCLDRRCVAVFCADNGVVREGVSQSGQAVTSLVAHAIAEGSSNVNLMAKTAGADVLCIDMGMAEAPAHPSIRRCAPARGTQSIAQGPAMTRAQAEQAIQTGIDTARQLKAQGYHAAAMGEMGIGNTTTTAAVTCALTGRSPDEITGRGAGLSDDGLRRKRETVRRALMVNRPDPDDVVGVLAALGGFDLAAMCGLCLGGMDAGLPIVLDGVISACAALCAVRLCPEVRRFLLPSHMSREGAAAVLFDQLGLSPVIRAGLALGEGTGAVLLFPLLDAALSVYGSGHTFRSLGMDAYSEPKEDTP